MLFVISLEKFQEKIKEADAIHICTPGLFDELSNALQQRAAEGVSVHIITHFSSDNDYNGTGSFPAVKQLIGQQNITIQNLDHLDVSFFQSDECSFLWFPVSRIFKADATGYNAVLLDDLAALKIKESLWPSQDKSQVRENLLKAAKATVQNVTEGIVTIPSVEGIRKPDEKKIQAIEKELKARPPVQPDLKRRIELINRTLQFIELSFKGANVEATKIEIPPHALPINDENLAKQLESKLKLFQDIKSNVYFQEYQECKILMDVIRRKYMFRVKSKNKNLFLLSAKEEMVKAIEDVKAQADKARAGAIQAMSEEIDNRKKSLYNEFKTLIANNPQYHSNGYTVSPDFILNSVRFPDPAALLDRVEIKYSFFDIALEDYDNKAFIAELRPWLSAEDYDKLIEREEAIGVR